MRVFSAFRNSVPIPRNRNRVSFFIFAAEISPCENRNAFCQVRRDILCYFQLGVSLLLLQNLSSWRMAQILKPRLSVQPVASP